jgi:hypothetical protein
VARVWVSGAGAAFVGVTACGRGVGSGAGVGAATSALEVAFMRSRASTRSLESSPPFVLVATFSK